MWCIPPKQNAEFVARMEDVLTVYKRPYDPDYPVVCMDEQPVQLLDECVEPIPMSEDNPIEKYDCEYERKGSCSIFMFTEPLGCWREAHARLNRTAKDWAQEVKWLLDVKYPDAKKVVLVMDNLNTHTTASFYKEFSPPEAFRLSQRLEIHHTPKHGSWLDMAECELAAMSTQALIGRRIPDIETLSQTISAWATCRNNSQTGVSWHFTTEHARIKLKRLYPEVKK